MVAGQEGPAASSRFRKHLCRPQAAETSNHNTFPPRGHDRFVPAPVVGPES